MAVPKNIIGRLGGLLEVSTLDPDDARRRKLLNILLIGIMSLISLVLLATFVPTVADILREEERLAIMRLGAVAVAFIVIITPVSYTHLTLPTN